MNLSWEDLVGNVVRVDAVDATELQFTYEDGRVRRVFAEDPDGFWAWLHIYEPESPSEPTVAQSGEADPRNQ